MKNTTYLFTLLAVIMLSQPVYATVALTDSAFDDPGRDVPLAIGEIFLLSPLISVDGNLYLDYSVFSDHDGFMPSGVVTFDAKQVFIFPGLVEAPITDLNSLTVVNTMPDFFKGEGDALFFSDPAIINGQFFATENIYIGNYSEFALTAVPVPAAFWFFVSGLSVLFSRKFKRS